jgi:hypothetical protein
MLPPMLKVAVAVRKPNILAMWEVFKMIIVPIMPHWNTCFSICNGEGGGACLHVTNGRVNILKLYIMLFLESIHADLRA